MPDRFVPADTARYTKFLVAIRRHNLINEQVLRYVDTARHHLLRQYPDFNDFAAHYTIPQAVVDSVLAQAERLKITPKDSDELQKTLPDLRFLLKSLVAYDVWDRNEYFRLINEESDIVKAALKEWER